MKPIVVILFLVILLSFGLLGYNLVSVYSKPAKVEPVPIIQKPIQTSLNADKLWSLIQSWRQSEGLKPYIKDQRLCVIAQDRVDDPDSDHSLFYQKYSSYPFMLQENKTGAYSEQNALSKWLNSASHSATLKRPYAYSCVATFGDYAVQIFSNFKEQ